MSHLPLRLHALSPLAAGLLITSVWQGLLLTCAVALSFRLFRGISPGARAAVWTAVLLLVVLLPLLAFAVPHGASVPHYVVHLGEDWSVALVAVWATLSAWRAAQLGLNGLKLWNIARRAIPVAVEGDLARLLQQPRRAELCVSGAVDRPSVTGFFRPRVLLPQGMLEALSNEDLAHVVLHEMEHLRRGDDWLNLLQQICLLLLPLNPALLWLDRQLCRERELACDDGVLQTTQARKAYAACLVKLAEDSLLRKGMSLALSALGAASKAGVRESELVGRVRRILAGPEAGIARGRTRWALGSVAAGLVLLAGLLTRSPQVVRFDGMPTSTLAAAATAATGETASAVTAPMPMPSAAGAMVPVKAGTSTTARRAVLRRAVLRATRPVRPFRRLRAVAVAGQRPAFRELAVWSEDRAKAPRAQGNLVPAVQTVSATQAHIMVTDFEISQPVYAAVPVQGGWLIVQL